MRAKRLLGLSLSFLCVFSLVRNFSSIQANGRSTFQGKGTAPTPSLDASVQISISACLNTVGESGAASEMNCEKVIANGIGSLIQDRGEVLLVTHNHWGPVLQDLSLIEFRDARNKLISRMFGFEFKNHILFQDSGTLILKAPEQVTSSNSAEHAGVSSPKPLVPAKKGHPNLVKVGEIVQVAFRGSGDRQRIEVLDAEVMAIDEFRGLAIFQLRSLDGQPLLQGDSGGGVWFQGDLVANTWTTLVTGSAADNSLSLGSEGDSGPGFTDFSFAAILPR